MTKEEQARFVHELSEVVVKELVELIENNSVPTEWSSKQMQRWISDRFRFYEFGESGSTICRVQPGEKIRQDFS